MPLYEAPDVLFNPSTFRPYTGIIRHEAMQLVFPNTEYARTQLVNFANSLPENFIPPNVIEGTEAPDSHTQ